MSGTEARFLQKGNDEEFTTEKFESTICKDQLLLYNMNTVAR